MTEFNYEKMVAKSLIYVVREALTYTAKNGLPEGHYFNVTFATAHPDVAIPPFLKEQYPDDMTVVLQYEFSALVVDENAFSVVLNFRGVPAKLYIPFASVRFFVDPTANFGLHFEPDFASAQNNDKNDYNSPEVVRITDKIGNSAQNATAKKAIDIVDLNDKKVKKNSNNKAKVIDFSSLKKK